jgi:endonuclease/exonuclease/phosphatase (EEP) superfamily protein YafD
MLNRLLILIVIGGLLPLGAELWWGLELFTHFRLQYLALAAVLLLAALAGKRRILALLLATTMAINAWPVLPYLPTAAAPQSEVTLTLLNVNVKARNPDHAAILRLIRASGADIVTLIELSPALDEKLAALDDIYPFRLTQAGRGNFGLAVLARYPLLEPRPFELGPTAAVEAVVELPGSRLRVFAAHTLPPMGPTMAGTRNRQLTELAALARLTEDPLLVCGDFNLSPYSPYFDRFETASNTRDVRRGLGIGFSWPTFAPVFGIPIDHCFVRGPWVAASVERMDQIGSDHYPVRVTLRRRDN